MNEVRHVVRDKVAVSLKPLEDDEKRICDLVLCGEPVTKAPDGKEELQAIQGIPCIHPLRYTRHINGRALRS